MMNGIKEMHQMKKENDRWLLAIVKVYNLKHNTIVNSYIFGIKIITSSYFEISEILMINKCSESRIKFNLSRR